MLFDLLRAEVRADHVLVAEHLRGGAGRNELPEVEHGGRLAAGLDEAHVVVDEHDEGAEAVRDRLDHAAQVLGLLVGQAGPWLVEEDDARISHHRARHLDEAPLVGAEAPDPCLGGCLEADEARSPPAPPTAAPRP